MAGVADLARARGREQATFLWIRVLAVAVVVFVVTTSFQARPAPGGHGEALGVAVLLVAFSGATLAEMWHPKARSAVELTMALAAVASAAALVGLQANKGAFLGVFPAVSYAALALQAASAPSWSALRSGPSRPPGRPTRGCRSRASS